jgi:hypothetical protein
MVTKNHQPVPDPSEILPGMEDMLPAAPDPEAEKLAKSIIAAGMRDNALRRAEMFPESTEPTTQAEVAVHQGAANEAMAHGRIEATGTKELPIDRKTAPRKRKVYQERDGRSVSTDIANAAAVEEAGIGRPMTSEMRTVLAEQRLKEDLQRAGGDARTALALAATRAHRTKK